MILKLLGGLAKIGLGGAIDRVLTYMERKADTETEREKVRSQVAVEMIRASVSETNAMAGLNKSKMGHQIFWWFIALFIVPLGVWWTAVIIDSIFPMLFPAWVVAELPPPLDEWAAEMIAWLFYVGSTVAGVAAAKGVLSR